MRFFCLIWGLNRSFLCALYFWHLNIQKANDCAKTKKKKTSADDKRAKSVVLISAAAAEDDDDGLYKYEKGSLILKDAEKRRTWRLLVYTKYSLIQVMVCLYKYRKPWQKAQRSGL